MEPSTTCRRCNTTTAESVSEHLAEHHPNELFDITIDPRTMVGEIRETADTPSTSSSTPARHLRALED